MLLKWVICGLPVKELLCNVSEKFHQRIKKIKKKIFFAKI